MTLRTISRLAAVAAALAAGSLALVGVGATDAFAAPLASGGPSCQALPTALSYTEFATGAVYQAHGDSDGQTAFGGTSVLSNFSIAQTAGLVSSNEYGFVAGGQVTGNGSTAVHNGNFYYDTGYTGVSVTSPGTFNAVSQANLPVNFAAEATSNANFSAELAALTTSPGDLTGSTASTLTLTSTQTESNGEYVWDLTAGQLTSTTSAVTISGVPTGGTIIINVPYSGVVTVGTLNVTIDGTSAQTAAPALAASTIFNFSAATSLTLNGDWAGAVFAPSANVTFSGGHIYGTLTASSIGSSATPASSEGVYGPLASGLCLTSPSSTLPEGRPLLMIGAAGLLLLGVVAVRRRRIAAAA